MKYLNRFELAAASAHAVEVHLALITMESSLA